MLGPGRQTMFYPAFVREYTIAQAYSWATPKHMNMFELIACLNYSRVAIVGTTFGAARFFHVFDSMVTTSVMREQFMYIQLKIQSVGSFCISRGLVSGAVLDRQWLELR